MSRNAFDDCEREYNRRMEEAEMRREERKKPYRCSDGFCGAEDCARCRPSTYWMSDEEEEC